MNKITHQTRRESYEETLKTVSEAKANLLYIIQIHGPKTPFELAAWVNKPVYEVRPRLTELEQAGLLTVTGKKWQPITQRNEAIYSLPNTNFSKDGQGFLNFQEAR